MLTESVLLAAAGASLGVLFALWGVDILYGSIPAASSRCARPAWTGRCWALRRLGGAYGFAVRAGARVARVSPDLVQSLKEGARSARPGRAPRIRGWLVIFEVALSVVLLAGAGVLTKSFARLTAVNPGFRPESVLTVRIQRNGIKSSFAPRCWTGQRGARSVRRRSVASNLPMTGQDWGQNLTVEGRPFRDDKDYVWACHRVASLDYFRTIGMRLLKGRLFSAGDTRDRPRVAVINEAFAKKAWPNEYPSASASASETTRNTPVTPLP